jgi:hypothetical protein
METEDRRDSRIRKLNSKCTAFGARLSRLASMEKD